ncbi:MAG: hypothetical protein KBB91_02765, partial [Candidatus Pacebacteria bacterium]|nr:hypothetical protein [Candidatus Paceibacterota bacterium]
MNALFFSRKTFISKFTSIITIAALLVQLTAPVIAYAVEESPLETQTESVEAIVEVTTEEAPAEAVVVVEQEVAPLVSVIAGNYNLNFICDDGWCAGQVFGHTMTVGAEDGLGDFAGTGEKPDTTWNMTGNFSDPNITMQIEYVTGLNIGYTMDLVGTRAPNGVMSGTATDSGQQTFRWTTSDVITVTATKIVCDSETDLPNWATSGTAPEEITADTATNWIAEHSDTCRLERGWDFQWGDQSTEYPAGGDTYVGVMPGYETFGNPTDGSGKTTVVIPVADITQLHFAEVQKDGYIPFTSQAFPGNTKDVSAEFYCMTDIANYDNYEGLGMPEDGTEIVPNKHYYCVAWNVLKSAQEEVKQCDVVSDTSSIIEGTTDTAVETWVHPAWVQPLWMTESPFAKWIWSSLYVQNPTAQEEKTFVKTFNLSDVPSAATIDLAADNGFILEINGTVIDDKITIETNYGSTVSYPVTNLVVGTNTIKVTVRNFAGSANPEENPAGALYRLHIEGGECSPVPDDSGRGKIHTIKFVDGVRATKASVDDAMFPMFINPSNGDFMLKSSGWVPGEDGEYEATTFAHPNGSVFTIDENLSTDLVGASCEDGRPFALVGYSTAATYNDAVLATKTEIAPAITIDGDQYLIVHNTKCTENPQVPGKGKIHVIKFIGGIRAT